MHDMMASSQNFVTEEGAEEATDDTWELVPRPEYTQLSGQCQRMRAYFGPGADLSQYWNVPLTRINPRPRLAVWANFAIVCGGGAYATTPSN